MTLIIYLGSTGCGLFYTAKNFTPQPTLQYKFGNYTDKINTDGYYYCASGVYYAKKDTTETIEKYDMSSNWIDYMLYIFYKDGTVDHLSFKDNYEIFKGDSLNNIIPYVTKNKEVPFTKSYGGIYNISNDTLSVEIYEKANILNISKWYALETRKFIIVDRNTLKLCQLSHANNRIVNVYGIYKFVNVDTIPSSYDVDIKKQKWMWENEDEWKAYKRELKARKDSLKRARKLNSKLTKK